MALTPGAICAPDTHIHICSDDDFKIGALAHNAYLFDKNVMNAPMSLDWVLLSAGNMMMAQDQPTVIERNETSKLWRLAVVHDKWTNTNHLRYASSADTAAAAAKRDSNLIFVVNDLIWKLNLAWAMFVCLLELENKWWRTKSSLFWDYEMWWSRRSLQIQHTQNNGNCKKQTLKCHSIQNRDDDG